jgi:hypothetical protein
MRAFDMLEENFKTEIYFDFQPNSESREFGQLILFISFSIKDGISEKILKQRIKNIFLPEISKYCRAQYFKIVFLEIGADRFTGLKWRKLLIIVLGV